MPRPMLVRVSKIEDDDDHNKASLISPTRTVAEVMARQREQVGTTKREAWPLSHFPRNEETALYPTLNDETAEDDMPQQRVVVPDEPTSIQPPVTISQIQAWQRQRAHNLPSQRHAAAQSGDDVSFASLASMSVLPSRFSSEQVIFDNIVQASASMSAEVLSSRGTPLENSNTTTVTTGHQRDSQDIVFRGLRETVVQPIQEDDDDDDWEQQPAEEEEVDDLIDPMIKEIVIKSPNQSSRNLFKESSRRSLLQQKQQQPLKILFLSAYGRHLSSAEALADQVLRLYPGSTCLVFDVWESDSISPLNSTLSVNKQPRLEKETKWQQRWVRRVSKVKPVAILMDQYFKFTSEGRIRQRIAECDPDAIVSVHPTMNSVPFLSVQNICNARKSHIPFFTVVDEVGKAQSSWFQANADKTYVASDHIRLQAKTKGHVPDENIVKAGIPIAVQFDLHAEALGNRGTPQAKNYQQTIRKGLHLEPTMSVVVVMREHDNEDHLNATVDELYTKFTSKGLDATICVICKQKRPLLEDIASRDWGETLPVLDLQNKRNGLFHSRFNQSEAHSLGKATVSDTSECSRKGEVKVIALGHVSEMAEYMVAADVMLTSADPRSIAEAAAVGLPLMLTSIRPGVKDAEFVIASGFGWIEKTPVLAAKEVASWIENPKLLETMSRAAYRTAHPRAATDIVLDIGTITQTWMKLNSPAPKAGRIDEVQ